MEEVLQTRIGGKAARADSLDSVGDSHHVNSTEAVRLGRDIWSQSFFHSTKATLPEFTFKDEKIQLAIQSAKESRSRETKFASNATAQTRTTREAAVKNRKQATKEEVMDWLKDLKYRTRKDGRLYVNQKQFEPW